MLDKFKGCIIGCAVGDATGSPVEAKKGEVCQRFVEENVRPQMLFMTQRDQGNHSFGQYTDDSQLMRELAISLVENKGFVPEDYARRLVSLFTETIVVGYGTATKQSVMRLQRGTPWNQSGAKPPSAGNGSAMRAGPIGLFYRNVVNLVRAAEQQGIMTHADPRCTAGATAIAGAVAYSLDSNGSALDWWDNLGELINPLDNSFARSILLLPTLINEPLDKALAQIQGMSSSDFREYHWDGISPYVVPSVLWSLYSFLRTPDDFWETICTSIWPGGDVDTTAAMAGTISGAFNGIDAIPQEVAKMVNDYGGWGYNELCELAEKLYAVSERAPA